MRSTAIIESFNKQILFNVPKLINFGRTHRCRILMTIADYNQKRGVPEFKNWWDDICQKYGF